MKGSNQIERKNKYLSKFIVFISEELIVHEFGLCERHDVVSIWRDADLYSW